ncbi:MAG: PilZ domain-containing protein [Elusimicrobia bacterium]|nr:PilZ domain-containing protein [Elusimicrobiota bacterium]
MATLSGGERRKSERSEREDFALRLDRGGKRLPDVEVRDISLSGIGFKSQAQVSPGDSLAFELRIPGGQVGGKAVVVWAEAFHMGYRAGARITRLGFFQRGRLKKALATEPGTKAGGGWLDTVLLLLAAAVAAVVAADLLTHPEVRAALAAFLRKGR